MKKSQIRAIKAQNYVRKGSGIRSDMLKVMKQPDVIRVRQVEGYVEGKLKTPFFEVGAGLKASLDRS